MRRKYKVTLDGALTMATELHKHGQLKEAESVYRDILKAAPDHSDALHLLGVTLHQLGETERGIEYLKRSLESAPNNPAAINNLGNIYRESGRLDDALDAYRLVLEIEPRHADTLVNLGSILRRQRRFDEALATLEKALEIDPGHASGYHNLGTVYDELKRPEEALEAFRKARELAPHDDKAYLAMASTLFESGRHHEALNVLQQVLSMYPDHAVAAHLLAAYSGKDVPGRAADQYVVRLFDDFSASFDESLARLDYQAPKLIGDLVDRELGGASRASRILDIGCGTGLCGPLIRRHAELLVGVDLSPKMLKKAAAKQVYDRLEEAELTAFMHTEPTGFDVVVCADTLVYFGDLADALLATRGCLQSGGSFFFTVEALAGEAGGKAYRLQHHGRYSHSRQYLEESLQNAGLDLRSMEEVVLRKEGGKPVNGYLVFARKP
jgi:predicted TPR repeat methyltransferase